jgi:hypothetical protein
MCSCILSFSSLCVFCFCFFGDVSRRHTGRQTYTPRPCAHTKYFLIYQTSVWLGEPLSLCTFDDFIQRGTRHTHTHAQTHRSNRIIFIYKSQHTHTHKVPGYSISQWGEQGAGSREPQHTTMYCHWCLALLVKHWPTHLYMTHFQCLKCLSQPTHTHTYSPPLLSLFIFLPFLKDKQILHSARQGGTSKAHNHDAPYLLWALLLLTPPLWVGFCQE